MQKLVFFVGVAGTGKTTVAKSVVQKCPAVFLDRDTLGGRFVEAFLENAGLKKDDRDSSFYKEHLRDLEYDTARDVCVENLKVGQNVFMISPFTKELKSNNWLLSLLEEALKSKETVSVKVVVVTLKNIDVQKKRIEDRNKARDTWKLANWHRYEDRVDFSPVINWDLEDGSVMYFDNSDQLTEEKMATVIDFINSK